MRRAPVICTPPLSERVEAQRGIMPVADDSMSLPLTGRETLSLGKTWVLEGSTGPREEAWALEARREHWVLP